MPNKPTSTLAHTARTAGSFVLPNAGDALSTPPLSPSVVACLRDLGIFSVADVQRVGAVTAFALIKASGLTVTLSVLWQLAALSRHLHPHQLSPDDKQCLQDALKQLPPQHIPPDAASQQHFMRAALTQAHLALEGGEVPIGAVVVHHNTIIARAHNQCIAQHFVGAHAEMLAMQRAGQVLGNYRLSECDVYVTVEPCVMCSSALLQARVQRIFYGVAEPKTGGVVSQLALAKMPSLNHHSTFFAGVLADDCHVLMQKFFQSRR